MIIKNIFSLLHLQLKIFILIILLISNSKAEKNNIKQYSYDEGVLSIMYHRFNESKYPSTNIQMEIFINHIKLIKDLNYEFMYPDEFKTISMFQRNKKILLTIDDAFKSFYEFAWPF